MAHIFLSDLKATLDNCITELEEIHFMFCKNPESDFTRNRKLSFRDYIQLLLQMQSKSVKICLYAAEVQTSAGRLELSVPYICGAVPCFV